MIHRPVLKNLAMEAGLDVSLYLHEVDERIGIGCDILAEDQVISRLSTLEFELTSSLEEANQLLPLLVSHASIVINDFGTETHSHCA